MSSVKDLLRGDVVDGSGTANYISKWSDSDTITNSVIYESSGNIIIGGTGSLGGQPLFVINPTTAEAVMGIQSSSASGYSAIDLYNSSGSAKGAFGYGNASVSVTAVQDSVYMYSTTDLRFLSGGLNERMRIDSSGNVGIGTSSPTYKLEVQGTNPVFRLKGGAGFGFLVDQNSSTGDVSQILYEASNLRFGTNSAERMRITSAGNVLINRTSVIAASPFLQIQGVLGQKSCIGLMPGGNGDTVVDFFNAGNAFVGYIRVNVSSVDYVTSSSDFRSKKNIEDWSDNVLDSFASIEPKKFNFNNEEDTDVKSKGFIAQDMVDKFPEAYPMNNEGYYSYNPSGMVVYLMKAIQELKAEIELLKSK